MHATITDKGDMFILQYCINYFNPPYSSIFILPLLELRTESVSVQVSQWSSLDALALQKYTHQQFTDDITRRQNFRQVQSETVCRRQF